MTPHRQSPPSNLGIRLRAVAVGMIVVGAAILLPAGTPAEAKDRPYLALGDSVVFGFITKAGFAYGNPDNFVGYPSYADAALKFAAANAACPGETTSGFISSSGADNGCRPYRAFFPLHVAYSSTQLDFATRFLQTNPNTPLVTIGLGANDVFLLQTHCAGDLGCINDGLPQVLATISSNMNTILGSLRAAGFRGVLIVVNYYSLDYTDPVDTTITGLLNQAITAPAAAHGAVVADVFTAFQAAAAIAGGKPCNAGLLNASPQNEFICDVHPSQSGQQLLAETVEAAYRAAPAGKSGN